jgi:calcium-dependent phosphoinositide phospholipase C
MLRTGPKRASCQCFALLLGCGLLLGCAAPLHINDIQVVATHNSYKQRMDAHLLALLQRDNPKLARQLDYGHLPLAEQLERGVRGLELDVWLDPQGGRFIEPPGLARLRAAGVTPEPVAAPEVMRAPGFKVLHGINYDFHSSCPTLRGCLVQVRAWSLAHPRHVPIIVLIEPKRPDPTPGAPPILPFDAQAWAALDREIEETIGREHLIVPDDVRGDADTLEQAVRDEHWPELDAARGKLLFVLAGEQPEVTSYSVDHRALRGRVMFSDALEGTPEAAVRIVNDPQASFEYIEDLVRSGYIVRTRADVDTDQARSGDTRRRDAALASGAQLISTDYVVPDRTLGTAYSVHLPEPAAARCNPLRAQPCTIRE